MATFDYRNNNKTSPRPRSLNTTTPANGGGTATISRAVPGADKAIFPDLRTSDQKSSDYAEEVRKRARDMLAGIDRTAERGAYQDKLQATTSDNVKSTGARMGLGGLGMSGASAAAENQARLIGRNNEQMSLGQYDRDARTEDTQRLKDSFGIDRSVTLAQYEDEIYKAARLQLETELGVDINEDGVIGVPTGSNSGETIGDRTSWPTYNWNEKDLTGATKIAEDGDYYYYQDSSGGKFKIRKIAVATTD